MPQQSRWVHIKMHHNYAELSADPSKFIFTNRLVRNIIPTSEHLAAASVLKLEYPPISGKPARIAFLQIHPGSWIQSTLFTAMINSIKADRPRQKTKSKMHKSN
ncbi:MAG: hypothetical protein H6939_05360 [Burkholderiales bacterium]|nr:hypothetical protein [Burkholderiales bacterium]